MKIKDESMVRNVLNYLSPTSGASIEEARGVVIGVVGAFMAFNGSNFQKAIAKVKNNLPEDYQREKIPEEWLDHFPEFMEFDVISLSCLQDGDGSWSVNDANSTGEVLKVPAYRNEAKNLRVTDEALLKALKTNGWIKPRIRSTSIEIEGEPDFSFYINDVREAMPLYELRRRKED